MQPLPSPYQLPPGSTLDRYRIIRRLAVGGMAEIYLACITGLEGFEKRVVLKRILPQYACRPEFVGMFLDEARLAATLHHPNIAQVYDIGSDGESYYFAMEYVEGRDVRHIRKRAAARDEDVPLHHTVSIAMGVAGGLHHAHEKRSTDGTPLGIVHRDVSAANIIVTYDGTVKLIDFGIAKASRRQTQTRTGILKGKACSMSPEQCLGEALDRRSDIFSLGILLYELSTATRLFAGDSEYETMKLIVNGKVEPPSRRRPEYPERLEQIVLRALERDPADRYQSAQELFLDLDVFARDERMAVSPYSLAAYVEHLFPAEAEAPEEGASPPLFLLGNDAELPDGLLAKAPESASIDIEFGDEESLLSGERALERAETVELSASGVSLPRSESDPGSEPSDSSPRARTITLVPASGGKRRAASERRRASSPRARASSPRERASSPDASERAASQRERAASQHERRLSSDVGTSLVKVKSNRAPSTPVFQSRLSLVVLTASVAVAMGILGFGFVGGRGWLSSDRGDAAPSAVAARDASRPAVKPAPAEAKPVVAEPAAAVTEPKSPGPATVATPAPDEAASHGTPAAPKRAERQAPRHPHRASEPPDPAAEATRAAPRSHHHGRTEAAKAAVVRTPAGTPADGASGGGAAAKPAASKPAASKPAASKPAASKPAASKPAASKPTAIKSPSPAAGEHAASPRPAPDAPPAATRSPNEGKPAEPRAPSKPASHDESEPHPPKLLSE